MFVKNSFGKIFIAFFCFFFVLTINVNARYEDDGSSSEVTSLSIKCTYGAFVVGYTDTTGEIYATTDNENWNIDTDAITLSNFQKADSSYYCPDTLYYSPTNSAIYILSYKSKDSYGSKYSNETSLQSEDIKVPDEGTTPPPETYKTCSYGANGSITISYNNTDVKTSVASINSTTQIVTDYSVSSFANGCPEQVYTVNKGYGYYAVHLVKGEGDTEVKRKDLIDAASYAAMCEYKIDDTETNKISIYTNGKGDYYVKSSLDCDQSNMDFSEIAQGCFETIYYKTATENGKNVCYYTFDKDKGYPNSAKFIGSGFFGGDPLSCDDFTTDDGVNIVSDLFNIIMIIGPILALVLGGLDFAKATLASDESALKKAGTKFGKRIIAAILLFLLPLIINLILGITFNAGVFEGMEDVPAICLTQE
jgi:hypothetical protein